MMDYVVAYAKPVVGPPEVLVVRKNKPDWQVGRLNLVGGKIEDGETPEQAAVRELFEESGLEPVTPPQMMGAIFGSWGTVYCVRIGVFNRIIEQQAGETEEVLWVPWDKLRDDPKLIPNLRVVIPLMAYGVTGWAIEDEGPSWDNNRHTISISVQGDVV